MENAEAESEGQAQFVRALLHDLCGEVDPAGLELARLVRLVGNQLDALVDERLRAVELSGPRLALLLRLMAEEKYGGDRAGVSPTHLSRCQRVSKNTISALLRGLEEQGLIERTLDPSDLRAFRIRVSPAGRALAAKVAPAHVAYLHDVLGALSMEEQAQLLRLLRTLHAALAQRGAAESSEIRDARVGA